MAAQEEDWTSCIVPHQHDMCVKRALIEPFDLRISPIDKGAIPGDGNTVPLVIVQLKKGKRFFVSMSGHMCDTYLSRAVVLQLHPPAPQADYQVNVALKCGMMISKLTLWLPRPNLP